MIDLLRRLLGMDRFEAVSEDQRDREDALRSADRARGLAEKLRGRAHEGEFRLRVEVLGRRDR